jgi:hypothetical protein
LIVAVITRETATVNGSLVFYINGTQLGNSIILDKTWTGAGSSVSNTGTFQILGTSLLTDRIAGTCSFAALYNRALTAAEVAALHVSLARGGTVAAADQWGSQTAITANPLVVGKKYRINAYVADDDFTNIGGTNVTRNEFTATGTDATHFAHSSLVLLGATICLAPGGINATDWQDSSSNNLDAAWPASGYTIDSRYMGDLLVVKDSAGRKIQGWIKAQGAGETLGAEINSGTLTALKLYKITATEVNHFGTGLIVDSYFTSAGIETCDASNKVKEVTAVAATGVTISSTKGGTALDNWTAKDAAFDHTTAKAYEIHKVLTTPVVASGSILAGAALLDTTTANAFYGGAVDLTAYQTGKFMLAFYDASGYAAIGWISGTAPAGLMKAAAKTVVSISKANPGILTLAASHGYTNGMLTYFSGLTEMTDLNTKYRTLAGSSGDTFQLEDTSGYAAAETTGGAGIERVTDVVITGALILSSKAGSRGWLYKHASFDPRTAMTYKVFYIGD